ncbi:MAG: tyrosine--tRNA ligase [bacterium]
MAKIITDHEQVNEVLTRGVEKIYPNKKHLQDILQSGQRIRLYCGFDPSAPSLHVGHAIQLNKLAQFQALGHEVIFLIGDFTGMIGDPTDKQAVRKKLTRQEVLANAQSFVIQAKTYLNFSGNNAAKVKYNSQWQDKLNFTDLVELSSNFTVQQMIQRDMFQARIKEAKPIYLHEFLYPLAQAYDSVMLDVDLEVGGNDQLFNMMAGRDLMKALGKKKDKAVMTLQLLTDATGAKMGKTSGNALFLDTDAKNMYGLVMSWPDEVIVTAFELCTKTPWSAIKQYKKQLSTGANPRDIKMALALAITKLVHGDKSAKEAQAHFSQTIQQKQAPKDIKTIKLTAGITVIAIIAKYFKDSKSKGQIRRLINEGAVSLNDQKITDHQSKAQPGIYKAGKRDWFKVI